MDGTSVSDEKTVSAALFESITPRRLPLFRDSFRMSELLADATTRVPAPRPERTQRPVVLGKSCIIVN